MGQCVNFCKSTYGKIASWKVAVLYDSTMYPLLKRRFRLKDEQGTILIERGKKVFFIERETSQLISRMRPFLNGRHHISEITNKYNIPVEDCKNLFNELISVGLVTDLSSSPEFLDGSDLIRLYSEIKDEWIREIYSHRIWDGFRKGTLLRNVVLGWIMENFQYITSAGARLGLAASCCNEARIRTILCRHCAEEYDHCKYFLKSTIAAGFTETEVRNAIPLPSTITFINQMRYAATSDWLAYAFCGSILEGTGEKRHLAKEAFNLIEKHYNLSEEVFEPWLYHLNLDKELEHSDIFDLIVGPLNSVPIERVSNALETARLLVEAISQWHDEIINYYSNPNVYIPRQPLCA